MRLCDTRRLLPRHAQAKLALIVAQCLSIHLPSVCVSVRDSLSHVHIRRIARREPRRLPACLFICLLVCWQDYIEVTGEFG